MKFRILTAVLLAILIIVLCGSVEAAGKLNIVATTSLLQSAAEEIGGKNVNVSVLITPGSCPGHYDICPRDIRKLSSSKLILAHGYEGFIDNLVKSMGANKPELVKTGVNGNWMVPDVFIRGAEKVADALCKADPKNSKDYRNSYSLLKTHTKKLSDKLKSELKTGKVSRISVLCSSQQAPVLKWMGFRVAGTYDRAEEFTPAQLHKLTLIAQRQKVGLVVDNLQSGPAAGRELARDIKAAHVTLSNFPGGFAGTGTWSKCVEDNVRRILKAIK